MEPVHRPKPKLLIMVGVPRSPTKAQKPVSPVNLLRDFMKLTNLYLNDFQRNGKDKNIPVSLYMSCAIISPKSPLAVETPTERHHPSQYSYERQRVCYLLRNQGWVCLFYVSREWSGHRKVR